MHLRLCKCSCASATHDAISLCKLVSTVKYSTPKRLAFDPLPKRRVSLRRTRASSDVSAPGGEDSYDSLDSTALPENFCIIESRESVKNFANMQLDEIKQNIQARRNKIFLLMEEVRRLRIQQRLKGDSSSGIPMTEPMEESYPSFIPFFPPITEKTLQLYINFYVLAVASIILFGGLVAPVLEVKLGVGGTTYNEFISGMHLPQQLAEVDPIVASFCGGAVGVLTSLLVVEANNAKIQARRKCIYCEGTGYLTCGACLGTGVAAAEQVAAATVGSSNSSSSSGGGGKRGGDCTCAFCSGTGKVMCTACLCTGKQLATEHDPRVDPFSAE